MTPAWRRSISRVITCVLLSVCTPARTTLAQASPTQPPAFASAPGDSGDTNPSLLVTTGLGNTIVADHWNLVRADISPGTKPVSGLVVVETYLGVRTYSRSYAPFVSIPGIPTRVDQVVALPRDVWQMQSDLSMRVMLRAQDGTILRSINLNVLASGTSVQLPMPADATTTIIAGVGRTSLDSAAKDWGSLSRGERDIAVGDNFYELWSRISYTSVDPDDLPTNTAAYEAVGTIVVSTAVMDRIGDKALGVLLEWVRGGGRLVLVGATYGNDLARWGLSGKVEVRPEARGRARVNVLPEGAASGFGPRWTPVLGPLPFQGPPESIEVIDGPLGLGWLTLVPVDPQDAPTKVLAGDAWLAVLSRSLGERLPHGESDNSYLNDYRPPLYALDTLAASMPAPGAGPMIAVVSVAVVLALMLGPVDWLWLRRRKLGHWSWATATCWILIAATLAYFAPQLARSGRTQLRRIALVDCCLSTQSDPAISWRTALTSVLASSSGERQFVGTPSRAWWKRERASDGGQRLAGVFATDQAAAALPAPTRMDVWTLNSFREDAPIACSISATIEPVAELAGNAYRVSITGLPAGMLSMGQLHIGDRHLPLELTRDADGTCRATARSIDEGTLRMNLLEPSADSPASSGNVFGMTTLADDYALTIPGVVDRGESMNSAVQTGKWAVVCVVANSGECDVSLEEPTTASQQTIYRILIPVSAATGDGEPST